MNKAQYIVIGSILALFMLLYFGCSTTPKNQKDIEKSRSLSMESTSPQILIEEAKVNLNATQRSDITSLEMIRREADQDSTKLEVLEKLSSKWFSFGYPAVAGYFAQEIAQIKEDEDSWAITGSSFSYGLGEKYEPKIREFSRKRAIDAFEKAIAINPKNVDHRLNLAIIYTEMPPEENPMQGILMLRELNQKFPESAKVLNQLGKLSIKTNQGQNAVKRLKQAEAIDSNNVNTICLLSRAYELVEDTKSANYYADKCERLIK